MCLYPIYPTPRQLHVMSLMFICARRCCQWSVKSLQATSYMCLMNVSSYIRFGSITICLIVSRRRYEVYPPLLLKFCVSGFTPSTETQATSRTSHANLLQWDSALHSSSSHLRLYESLPHHRVELSMKGSCLGSWASRICPIFASTRAAYYRSRLWVNSSHAIWILSRARVYKTWTPLDKLLPI